MAVPARLAVSAGTWDSFRDAPLYKRPLRAGSRCETSFGNQPLASAGNMSYDKEQPARLGLDDANMTRTRRWLAGIAVLCFVLPSLVPVRAGEAKKPPPLPAAAVQFFES